MENSRQPVCPVLLKGLNYLLWSRTMKTTLGSRGLWEHVLSDEAPVDAAVQGTKDGQTLVTTEGRKKWDQEDLMVMAVIQASLDAPILEAYSYCETAKDLWETLQHVYGNSSNLMRIFEVKKAINNLHQAGMEFTKYFGQFRALWAELEMLRPSTIDPLVLSERREQDKVFALLMNLDPIYSDLIKHLLREDKLPTLENVCAKVQKEQGSHGLFGHKEPLITANKGIYTPDDKKAWVCDHCKKDGHTRDKCWILHPHLVPPHIRAPNNFKSNNGNKWRKPRAHLTQEVMVDQNKAGPSQYKHEGAAHALASSQSELVKKPLSTSQLNPADLEAIINALRESGNSGYTFNASSSLKPLIVDSGASHHMISDSKLISNIKPVLGNVVIANGEQVPIRGIGSLKLFNKDSKASYLPSFTSNLLSVKQATTDLNCHAIFSPNGVCFQDIETHKVLGKGVTKDDLYVLEDLTLNSSLSCASVLNNSGFKGECFKSDSSTKNECVYVSNEFMGDLWHARLGHPHFRALGLIFPKISFKNDECEACILGKHCKSVFPKSNTVYEHCFDLIHSDVWTSPYESREHHKYFVTFIDEKSKYTWVTLLPSKDRVLEAFINFHAYVSNHYNAKIKCFRSDNGGEYTSHAFKEQLIKHGITHQTSCPYTPQQNGVAERKNRHLMEVARSMMFHMNVPKRFWSDALVSACYLINRIPTKILQDISPFEVLNKTKPMLNHLRVFGCVCFVLVPGDHRNKLEAKSTKAMLIGYSTTQKGYKCYVPETRRVLVSRDVKFMETKAFYEEKNWEAIKDLSSTSSDRAESLRRILENIGISQPVTNPSSQQETKEDTPEATITADEGPPVDQPSHLEHEGGDDSTPTNEYSGCHDQDDSETPSTSEPQDAAEGQGEAPMLRRSNRLKFPSHWKNTRVYYNYNVVAHPEQAVCSLVTIPQEHRVFIGKLAQEQVPKSYEEAKEHKVWRDAVGDEHHAMERNHTWVESDLPKGKKAVSSRWIFTIKYKSNGEIERHKARLVARGFTQTYGEDYRDTFAPVAKMHTIRVVLALAANLEWDLWQMDVKNAFLQGELEEEVYMTPPPGLEHIVSPGKVLRLRKAIYGLKQSPRTWYHKLSVTLRDRGFKRSEADHTLFTHQSQKGIVVILIYVDDIIISGNDKVGIASTKEYLKSVFDIKDLGELKYFLGIEVCRFKDGLFISQRKYILDLLTEAGKLEAKAAKTPLEEGYKVEPEGELEGDAFEDARLYRRMVGKLIYLTITRPDLCFAVNQVSQHMQAPKKFHWMMIDRILRYLKGTQMQGIWMGNNQNTEIVGYCDADWAGDRNDRKSTTGYCTFIGGNLVTWKTKKQKVVSCSSAEAEYRAMRKLTTECIWLKALLNDLGIETKTPITMHCDNQAAIHIASNSVFHERTKHIEVDCHKVRQAVEQGIILPCYTRSSDQLADIFTKAASLKVCESIHPKLGLIDIPNT